MSENPDRHARRPGASGTRGAIDLWLFSRDVDARERIRLAAYLSPEERTRTQRFLDERDSHRYAATRGRLREILSSYVGLPPAQISFRYGDRGKPYLEGMSGLWCASLGFSNAELVEAARDHTVEPVGEAGEGEDPDGRSRHHRL